MKFFLILLSVLLAILAMSSFAAIDLSPISNLIVEFCTAVGVAIGVIMVGVVGYMALIWGSKATIKFVNSLLHSA